MGCSSILYRPLEACQVKLTIQGQIKEMITPYTILEVVLAGSTRYDARVLTMMMELDDVLMGVDLEGMLLENNL